MGVVVMKVNGLLPITFCTPATQESRQPDGSPDTNDEVQSDDHPPSGEESQDESLEAITPTNVEYDQYSSFSYVETSISPGFTETVDEQKLQAQYSLHATHERLPAESSDSRPEQPETPSRPEESSSDQQGGETVERSDATVKDPGPMSGSKQDTTGLHPPKTMESSSRSELLDSVTNVKGDGELPHKPGSTGDSSGMERVGGPKGDEAGTETVEDEKASPDVQEEEEVAGEEPGEGMFYLVPRLTWGSGCWPQHWYGSSYCICTVTSTSQASQSDDQQKNFKSSM